MNKIFNYIRVSSKEQNEQRQVESMNKFNHDNNIEGAIQLIDKATGTNTDRPNLQLMLQVIGEGDLLVIKSIDRLSRNYKEVMELWNTITNKGADIVVIDMPLLDTRQYKDLLGDFISNLILQVLGYVAQQETEFRSKRQIEGIEAMPIVNGKKVSIKTGMETGRPNAEYPSNWEQEYQEWQERNQTATVTMNNLGLKRTTFYKLVDRLPEIQSIVDLTNNCINKLPKGTIFDLPKVVANWEDNYTTGEKIKMGKNFKEAVNLGKISNVRLKGINVNSKHMEYEKI